MTPKERDSWRTPPELFYWLNWILNFQFEIDAAAIQENALCDLFFTDGLETSWHKHGKRIYINPPYSDLARWLQKAYLESQLGCTCVVLIPSHKGESWWDDWIIDKAERVILLKGRIRFIHPVSGQLEKQAPFGSSFVIYSPHSTPERDTILKKARLVDIFAQVYQLQGRDIKQERRDKMQEKKKRSNEEQQQQSSDSASSRPAAKAKKGKRARISVKARAG